MAPGSDPQSCCPDKVRFLSSDTGRHGRNRQEDSNYKVYDEAPTLGKVVKCNDETPGNATAKRFIP